MKNIISRYIKKFLSDKLRIRSLFCFVGDFVESQKRLFLLYKIHNPKLLKTVCISVLNQAFNPYITSQTQKKSGIVNNVLFATKLFPDIQVVVNKSNPYVPLLSKTGQKWLIHIEPPGYISCLGLNNTKHLKKFTRVYTSDPELYSKGGKYIASPPFVHWHLEYSAYSKNPKFLYTYDFLKDQVTPPMKSINLTAINSNINALPGHKLRANFIRSLCDIGFDFELYGGTNWSKYPQYRNGAKEGKWPIYSISRFVLVIENESAPYYWTEKIADSILCWSMPIYYGAPNIGEYFPEGSYIALDIKEPNALDTLKKIIESNYYENNISNLAKARQLILNKLNLFNFIASEVDDYYEGIERNSK